MLACTNINFSYGTKQVLHDVNLSFSQGALVGLWGHNGSGKSTLLKLLGASLPITHGELTIFGHNGLDKKGFLAPRLRHHFGILLQDFSSDEKISLIDNLIFAARLMGLDQTTARTAALATLAQVDLLNLQNARLKTLSGGMRRRLELYRTFMHQPKIVLLDEPTAGLDFEQSAKFLNFVRSYQQQHEALVIFSTHRPREHEICHQVVVMEQGRIIAQDSPQKLLANLNFMTCTFQLNNPAHDDMLAGIKLFPQKNGCDPLTYNAHLTHEQLTKLLANDNLLSSTISSLLISKPSLNDAFSQPRSS